MLAPPVPRIITWVDRVLCPDGAVRAVDVELTATVCRVSTAGGQDFREQIHGSLTGRQRTAAVLTGEGCERPFGILGKSC